jgi:EAL domain-containing protein (putative c-di-GMP-specific phosphodiesterase class I)
MQGFMFSRPVPATRVREAIAAAQAVAQRLAHVHGRARAAGEVLK